MTGINGRQIALIDDQPEVRRALGDMLQVFGYSLSAFASAEDFLAVDASAQTGCVICDVRMPGMDGIALLRELAKAPSPPPVILISGHADVPMAVEALKSGAFDFIEKPVDDVKLVASINRALASRMETAERQQASLEIIRRFETLTPREAEVFDLVALGLTSQAIGDKLGISVRTVESYRAQIMDKMQADGVATLVRQAIRLGRAGT